MVMIEAMACGTPVVALRRGSVPELVPHGVAGLVVDRYEDFPAALRAADAVDPASCRQHAQTHFDLPVMADGYERVYHALVTGRRLVEEVTQGRVA
jgi:glycosyltransferase involved in cell wall biosynthesis